MESCTPHVYVFVCVGVCVWGGMGWGVKPGGQILSQNVLLYHGVPILKRDFKKIHRVDQDSCVIAQFKTFLPEESTPVLNSSLLYLIDF